jgi:hypothetical protein
MPFSTLNDAQNKLWESVYNSSKAKGDSAEVAAKKAWSAISGAYKKVGDKWVKKSEIVRELSMTITSVPFDKATGEMRWKAVASDTDKDLYDDAMSHELYKSFLDNIEKNVPPPEPFGQFVTSNWWKGGMPYLSLSHFSDLDGEAVPGKLDSIYVDGKCLKAKGNFIDNNLGRICWKALNKDFAEHIPDDKRIRISIAFLDLAHKHGDGEVFERKSLTSVCKECAEGVGDKTYLKGYLVHLAMTRVPVNPRAEMEVEKSMSKKTREEDAASIVGEEEAKKLAEKSALVGRADILVEKADVPIVEEAKACETKNEDEMTEEEKKKKKEEELAAKKSDVLPEVPPVEPVVDTVSKEETPEPEKPVEPAPIPEQTVMPLNSEFKALSEAITKVMSAPATPQEKMAMIAPEIKNLGTAIERAFSSSEAEQPKDETSVVTMETVRSLIEESNKPVMDTLTSIQTTLAELSRPTVQKSEVQVVTPRPRSPDPNVMRSLVNKVNGESRPKSVLEIVREGMGLPISE